MPPKPFKLYVIDGVDYEAVIAEYRRQCLEGLKEVDNSSISLEGPYEPQYIIKKEPRDPLRDDTRILNKAKYLVHTIAYRQATSQEEGEDGVSINMSVLQKVIHADAFELMGALINCGYIRRSSVYQVAKFSRKYKTDRVISTEPCNNATINKYIEKTKQILQGTIIKHLTSPDFVNLYGDSFAQTYIKNLNAFKITDKEGFNIFAKQEIQANPNKQAYYDFIEQAFQDKLKIYSIDANHRIYHILTSLKRELKPYINIRYSIDCANSHPVLFNYFIFQSKGIDLKTAYIMSSILIQYPNLNIIPLDYRKKNDYQYLISTDSTNPDHYNIIKLYKVLEDNGIGYDITGKFRLDEMYYIWKTTCGSFWDDILREHVDEGLTRAEIKQKMFAEVFYSKTTTGIWKRFLTEFDARYSHVYQLICQWKDPLSNRDISSILLRRHKAVEFGNRTWMANEATALPNVMMDLESEIFRDVLKALFRKRISAVHIHDAIVIPATKSTENLDPEVICEVMRNVYKRFGLCPTLKVETYH